MRVFLFFLFATISVSLVSISYAQNGDIHFHGGADPKTDFVYRGDTLTFYGWSNAYQSWQSGQLPSESTKQPTAARSPGLNLVTAEPTLVTRPTISWPGMHG